MTVHRQIWDISCPIHRATAVYPGDMPYLQSWTSQISVDCPVNVGSVTLSTHLGTHADAPLHYDASGLSAGEMALDDFIGPCRVIHAIDAGRVITWQHMAHAITPDIPPRVLVRTYHQAPQHWDAQLSGLAPDVIDQLADLGVRLIGIDTASIDPADSHALESHQRVRARDLRILENLVLDAVPEGDYELIALPLKMTEADASPVRAVLRSI